MESILIELVRKAKLFADQFNLGTSNSSFDGLSIELDGTMIAKYSGTCMGQWEEESKEIKMIDLEGTDEEIIQRGKAKYEAEIAERKKLIEERELKSKADQKNRELNLLASLKDKYEREK